MRGEAHSARCDARGGEHTSVSVARFHRPRSKRNATPSSLRLAAPGVLIAVTRSCEGGGSSDATRAAISTDTQVSDLHAKLSPAVLSKMREIVAGMMLLSASLDKVGSIGDKEIGDKR